jgi:hypothetical protein
VGSYRQIFKNYKILTVASLYKPEVICYMKKYKDSLFQNVHIHNNNMWIKAGFAHTFLQHSTLQEKCGKCGNHTVPQGARSYKYTGQSFKRELISFLLHHTFYSVDEFLSFWFTWIVKVWESFHWSSFSILINADIRAVYYTVLYFIYILWVLRV